MPFKAIIEGRNSFQDFSKEIYYGNAGAALVIGSFVKFPKLFFVLAAIGRFFSTSEETDTDETDTNDSVKTSLQTYFRYRNGGDDSSDGGGDGASN